MAQDKPRSQLLGAGLGLLKVRGIYPKPRLGGSQGAGGRLSAGGGQGGGGAQWQSQGFRKGLLKPVEGPFTSQSACALGPRAQELQEAVDGHVSKSTQGTMPTSYQLTPSLKSNGIFLAPTTFAGGQSPRERLNSSWPGRDQVPRKGTGAPVPSGSQRQPNLSTHLSPGRPASSCLLYSSLPPSPCPANYIHL